MPSPSLQTLFSAYWARILRLAANGSACLALAFPTPVQPASPRLTPPNSVTDGWARQPPSLQQESGLAKTESDAARETVEGWELLRQGDWELARERLLSATRSVSLAKSDRAVRMRAHLGLAVACRALGRADEALSALHTPAFDGVGIAAMNRMRADIYRERGWLEAEASARFQAVAADPDDQDARIELAWMLATSAGPGIREISRARDLVADLQEDGSALSADQASCVNEILAAVHAAWGNFSLARELQASALAVPGYSDPAGGESRMRSYGRETVWIDDAQLPDWNELDPSAANEQIRQSVVLVQLTGEACCRDPAGRRVILPVHRETLAPVIGTGGEILVSHSFLEAPVLAPAAPVDGPAAETCHWSERAPPVVNVYAVNTDDDAELLGPARRIAGDSCWNLAIMKIETPDQAARRNLSQLSVSRILPDRLDGSRPVDRIRWRGADFNSLEKKLAVRTVTPAEFSLEVRDHRSVGSSILFDEAGYIAALVPWVNNPASPTEAAGRNCARHEILFATDLSRVVAELLAFGRVRRFQLPFQVEPTRLSDQPTAAEEPDASLGLRVPDDQPLTGPIKGGDLIVAVNGKSFRSLTDLSKPLELAAARFEPTVHLITIDGRSIEIGNAAVNLQGDSRLPIRSAPQSTTD